MAEDQDEVDRLRAEVARLRGLVGEPATRTTGRGDRATWRPWVVGVLVVVAALLAPLAVVATWAHDEVGDSERYVETVAPLASDPAVQDAIVARVTTEIFTRIDIRAVTQDAVDALAERGLPPAAAASLSALASPLANGVRAFVEKQVGRLVRSAQFEQAWAEANRQAHAQLVAVLTGKTGSEIEATDGAVRVNLAAVIATVKERLVDAGFDLATRIPEVDAQFVILESVDLTRAQTGLRWLSAVATVLPWLAVGLLLGAVALAGSRRRALVAGALAVAASMLLLGVALNVFRVVYLDAIPPSRLSPAAAGAVYDALTHFIRVSLRSVLVLFLAVAVLAWATGPGPAPSGLRRGGARVVEAVRRGSSRAGLRTGPVGAATHAYKTPLRVMVLGGALLVYVMAAHPTAGFTLVLLAVSLTLLLVLEVVAQPPADASE